ncbi:MAG: glycosyltransferase family 2 protein [Thermoanaerobaculia bacterium]
MTQNLPEVACIVVNRDGGDSLFAAIRSVRAQVEIDLSIIVVDNASAAPERERLAREAPEARVIAFSRNLGFAGAANEGIARTRSPFVLLLNNDAVLAADYVCRLAARLALDDRLAGAQGLVLTRDGSRVDSAGIFWSPRGEALPVLGERETAAVTHSAFEVAGVSATAALFRREALDSVASHGEVFDPAFFAYYEDADLSLRLARKGWRFVCDPAAVARHEGSRTGRRTPLKRAIWISRNRWRTLYRNFDETLLRRSFGSILRADLAHARQLGWRGILLLVSVWPRILSEQRRHRQESSRLRVWPSPVPVEDR